jgi:hypothetical protein
LEYQEEGRLHTTRIKCGKGAKRKRREALSELPSDSARSDAISPGGETLIIWQIIHLLQKK